MKIGGKYLTIIAIILVFVSACERSIFSKKLSPNYELNTYIYEILKGQKWYLWTDNVPEIDPESVWDSREYFDQLLYKEIDRWSYIDTKASHDAHYEEGKYVGFGFGYAWDLQMNLRVAYVFPNSPMSEKGVKRGYKISEIGGKKVSSLMNSGTLSAAFGAASAGVTVSFKVESPEGEQQTFSIVKREVFEKSVLVHKVFTSDNIKTGYLFLKSFIEPTKAELKTAFELFKQENVKRLIIDLRYNGGGRLDVANYLGNLIAGNANTGKVWLNIVHNSSKADKNTVTKLDRDETGIDAMQVVIIQSFRTASASEIIINSLKPFVEVKTVGEKTHGKPVGMYSFDFEDMVIVPISFKTTNGSGEGDYYSGIEADFFVEEDLLHDLGDAKEICLKQALHYTTTGSFLGLTKKSSIIKPAISLYGLKGEIGAE